MFRPARKDDPEHQALLKKAVELLPEGLGGLTRRPVYKKRALQYLVARAQADKLNNPVEAEQIVTR